jgi:hypothetical protein
MVTLIGGTDTFGRVKSVGGTPIITKFAMLQFLPVFPLESFYFTARGKPRVSGIPFVVLSHSAAIYGIPLARVSRTSVAMAYIRGGFGAMTIVGFLAMVPGMMHLMGEPLDDLAMMGLRGLVASIAVGSLGGLLTYLVRLTSRRERRIRSACGTVLGICVDPAVVPAATAQGIEASLHDPVLCESMESAEESRIGVILRLVVTRARMARGLGVEEAERDTDELLDRLEHLDRMAT